MKKIIILITILAITQQIYSGGACSCCCGEKTQFESQPTRQVAALVRADTAHLKKILHSTSSKARRIKNRASIELNKHSRAKSREELERERKEQAALAAERQLNLLAERIAERQRKRAFERTRKASDLKTEQRERKDSKEESKNNQSLVVEEV